MTDSEYNRIIELRNKCYRDRRDRETDITYFTGFNDGYEKGREYDKAQIEKAKDLIELLLSDNRIMKAQFESEEQANIWFEHIHQAEQFISEVEK